MSDFRPNRPGGDLDPWMVLLVVAAALLIIGSIALCNFVFQGNVLCAINFGTCGKFTTINETVSQKNAIPTQASIATVVLTATPTLIPTPSPTPIPTPTPTSTNVGILCQSNGWQDWTLSSDWKVAGSLLVNDGSRVSNLEGPTAIPACTVPDTVQNFAIETAIVAPRPSTDQHFGFTVCGSSTDSGWQGYEGIIAFEAGGGYHAQIWQNQNKLAQDTFNPGTIKHTYRLEVRGNVITIYVDGNQIVKATDYAYSNCGGQVGLLSSYVILNVSSFKLIGL